MITILMRSASRPLVVHSVGVDLAFGCALCDCEYGALEYERRKANPQHEVRPCRHIKGAIEILMSNKNLIVDNTVIDAMDCNL